MRRMMEREGSVVVEDDFRGLLAGRSDSTGATKNLCRISQSACQLQKNAAIANQMTTNEMYMQPWTKSRETALMLR